MKKLAVGWAAAMSAMLAFGDVTPEGCLGNLSEEKPGVVVGQNNFDFDLPAGLTNGWGVSFVPEMPAEAIVDEAVIFFRTGPRGKPTGWYGMPFSPDQPAERLYLAFGDGWKVQAKPEGWDRISGVRVAVCFRRNQLPDGAFRLTLKDVRWHSAEPDEVRVARERMPQKVLACQPVAGERHFAWMNDLLDRRRFDWDPFVRRAAADGITDLVPLVATDEGAPYRSAVLPTDEKELAANGDQLELAMRTCRKYGLKLHAWKVNWSCFSEKSAAVVRYRSEGRFGKRWNGRELTDTLWLCPSDERNRKLEFDAMLELAGKGVDGIHFDYIRFDGRRTCYCDRCRALFENRLKRPVADWPRDCAESDGPLAAHWDAFRRSTITELVRRVSREVRSRYPQVEISAAVTTSHEDCAADWPRWCREKWLDFVCPMTYTPSLVQFNRWLDFANKVQSESGTPVYPGVGMFSSCSQLDALACARQLDRLRKRGFGGVSFFKVCGRSFPILDLLGKGPLRQVR